SDSGKASKANIAATTSDKHSQDPRLAPFGRELKVKTIHPANGHHSVTPATAMRQALNVQRPQFLSNLWHSRYPTHQRDCDRITRHAPG
ncbi:MAG: hypothetical protein WBP15_17325, partial [Tabrizicola sp.]